MYAARFICDIVALLNCSRLSFNDRRLASERVKMYGMPFASLQII